MLKCALLLGTSFHRYVLGEVMSNESFSPLVAWNTLISAVTQ